MEDFIIVSVKPFFFQTKTETHSSFSALNREEKHISKKVSTSGYVVYDEDVCIHKSDSLVFTDKIGNYNKIQHVFHHTTPTQLHTFASEDEEST